MYQRNTPASSTKPCVLQPLADGVERVGVADRERHRVAGSPAGLIWRMYHQPTSAGDEDTTTVTSASSV